MPKKRTIEAGISIPSPTRIAQALERELREEDLSAGGLLTVEDVAVSAFERGRKIGRGLRASDARPYAEGQDGKRPSLLLGEASANYSSAELKEWDNGFVAGYQDNFRG